MRDGHELAPVAARRAAGSRARCRCRARRLEEEVGGAGDRRGRIRLARGSRCRGAGQEDAEGEADEGGEEDVELEDEGMDDATFIEEQEEGDEDVTDIIGDVDDEEET